MNYGVQSVLTAGRFLGKFLRLPPLRAQRPGHAAAHLPLLPHPQGEGLQGGLEDRLHRQIAGKLRPVLARALELDQESLQLIRILPQPRLITVKPTPAFTNFGTSTALDQDQQSSQEVSERLVWVCSRGISSDCWRSLTQRVVPKRSRLSVVSQSSSASISMMGRSAPSTPWMPMYRSRQTLYSVVRPACCMETVSWLGIICVLLLWLWWRGVDWSRRMLLQGFLTTVLLVNMKQISFIACQIQSHPVSTLQLARSQSKIEGFSEVILSFNDEKMGIAFLWAMLLMLRIIIDRKNIMFRQFLQLDLQQAHNKQAYSLKKNQLIIRETAQAINFDAICYSAEDIASKIILEMVTLATVRERPVEPPTVTATFNYNVEARDLMQLIEKMLAVKIFAQSRLRIGHFEVRNGHISDYNRSRQGGQRLIDDLDQFEKEIDNCLKLERLWKINEYLTYLELAPGSVHSEMTGSGKKFGKRTNQFFVLEMEGWVRLVLVILPRSRECVFTREEEKEIEELYIINKHSRAHRHTICFTTPVAQILNNYLQNAALNLLLTAFPQHDRDLPEVMKLSLRLGNPHESEIRQILESYNQDKWVQLQHEAERLRKRLKEMQYSVKGEQDGMQRLIKIYSKTFNKSFSSIEYLRAKGVSSVGGYMEWLGQQIRSKEAEIDGEEAALKDLHREMIREEQRHLFYVAKIDQYRRNVVAPSARTTPQQPSRQHSRHEQENIEPTEQELLYFYDPQKEIARYRELKEDELKNKLAAAVEKRNFLKLMEEAKFKMGKADFNKLEQDYYDLISA